MKAGFKATAKAMLKATAGAVILAALAVGCANTSPLPTGMVADKFVTYACEGGKQFQARAAQDGSTVRIRYEGGYELDQVGKGIYEGSDWKFITTETANAELFHNGKLLLKACKLV